jgi:hypothetical protein
MNCESSGGVITNQPFFSAFALARYGFVSALVFATNHGIETTRTANRIVTEGAELDGGARLFSFCDCSFELLFSG